MRRSRAAATIALFTIVFYAMIFPFYAGHATTLFMFVASGTLLLGISIGATMEAGRFLTLTTLTVLALGFVAICLDTACGVLFGKLMCALTRGRVNPLIGAAGISAYPMAARVVQVEGQRYNRRNYLLMHAMGANTGGQLGSVMAAAIMLAVITGLGIR